MIMNGYSAVRFLTIGIARRRSGGREFIRRGIANGYVFM